MGVKKGEAVLMKKGEKKGLKHLDTEHNPQARIIYELVCQLDSYLPIASFEKLMEKLDEVVVDKYRLPLKIFAPFISKDLFPIETTEDLEQKLSTGVRRSVALASRGAIPVGNKLTRILATTIQEPKGYLSRVPVRNINSPAPASGSTADKGGK
ncbi:MAG: hypothetical protein WC856_25480 [Methylococcaceae bacterium]